MKLILISLVFLFFISCGNETYYKKVEPESGKVLSSEVIAVLDSNCSKCHAGQAFLKNYDAFKSKAVPMVQSGKMPPDGKMSEQDKSIILGE